MLILRHSRSKWFFLPHTADFKLCAKLNNDCAQTRRPALKLSKQSGEGHKFDFLFSGSSVCAYWLLDGWQKQQIEMGGKSMKWAHNLLHTAPRGDIQTNRKEQIVIRQ